MSQESEPAMSNRLQNIVTRQAKTRARDALFAAFVALAAVVGITTVNTAAHAASTVVTR